MRIFAGEVACERVLDQPGDQVRVERYAVGLADALDAAVGDELDEHEVAAAVVRWRIADHEGANVLELHGSGFTGRTSRVGLHGSDFTRRACRRATVSAPAPRTPASGTGSRR